MGWRYGPNDDFRCSCGNRIRDCRLFQEVEKTFGQHGLHFDPQNFGTEFRLSQNARANQLLTGPLPFIRSSSIERVRDRTVLLLPHFRRLLSKQQQANFLLMKTVLAFLGAEVYLDNSHSPHRLRTLNKNVNLDVFPVHLIRDPRGVSLSMMTNSGFSVSEAVESWIKHQLNIFRIANERRPALLLTYESLCRNKDIELARLHEFAGLEHEKFEGDFKKRQHHILGNRMRLSDGVVKLDERWKRDLSSADLRVIENRLIQFNEKESGHPLASIVSDYLNANHD